MTSTTLPIADPLLGNDRVTLRFVQPSDREAMRAAALDDRIWRYFTTRIDTGAEFDSFFDAMLSDHAAGKRLVWVVRAIDPSSGAESIAGGTAFGNLAIDAHQRIELGWSWLNPEFQGTGVNFWTKYELLKFGFDTLKLKRIEIKTDVRNTPARKALVKIGATEEGIFRSFNNMPDGTRRNAVYYSILAEEWPKVRGIWEKPKG